MIIDSGLVTGSLQVIGNTTMTGSLSVTGDIDGTLTGNARTATSASHAVQADSASLAANATTSSHALYAASVGPLTQDVEISGDLTVYGTSSFVFVTSSQLDVEQAFISVNVFEPAERFGGIKVYDSGSSNATASLAWDSFHNHWVYENEDGANYSGGMLLSGPRNTGSLGDEPGLTKWKVTRSDGGDHLNDTQIFSSGSITQITGSLLISDIPSGTTENQVVVKDTAGNLKYRTDLSLQGAIGTQGTQGVQGTAGYVGSDGIQGTQGTQGIQGTQGVQGTAGYVGSDGAQGTQGTQGLTGSQGTTGTQGTQGTQGLLGNQGATGASIQGTTGTQGIQGLTGDTGLGFAIAKVYSSVAALLADTAPTGIVAGQFALIETGNVQDADNSKLYLWNGLSYVFTNDLSGAAGIQGVQGIQGLSVQGITGTQGATGTQGTQGVQGTQGIQGTLGNTGAQGSTGASIQGTTGQTGAQGTTGTTGAQGTSGTNGSQGTTGTQGTTGSTGAQGTTGGTGSQGTTGSTGSQGTTGGTGAQGTTGAQGATGASAGITSYTNASDNRVLTSVSSTTINAEGNLTFDGSSLGITGGATASTGLTGAYIGTSNSNSTTGYGLSLYGGASAGQPTYGIMFAGTPTFGTHGSVSADWATYFTMDSTANRGWIFRNTSSGNVASINNAGILQTSGYIYSSTYVQSGQSMYSPIYYDATNSAYYVDPTDVSRVYGIGFDAGGVMYSVSSGTSYTSHIQIREAGRAGAQASNEAYAPAIAFHWSGVVASNILMEASGRIAIRNNPGSSYESFIAGNIYGSTYYDSNDTAYYTDPASTSRLGKTNIYRSVTSNIAGPALRVGKGWDTGIGDIAYDTVVIESNDVATIRVGESDGTQGGMCWGDSNTTFTSTHPFRFYTGGTAGGSIYNGMGGTLGLTVTGGYAQSNGSLRAPIFYDSDDTGYYADPTSTSKIAKVWAGAPNGNGTAPRWDTSFYVMQSQHWYSHNGTSTMYLGESGDFVSIRGYSTADGSFRSPIFYDSNDTSYYVNPNSVSIMNVVQPYYLRRSTHSTGHLEGSYNNVGANDAKSNPIYTIGSSYNPSDTSLSNMYGVGYAHPNFWGGGKTNSWGMYVAEGGTFVATIGVGIWTSGDVTAYSDIRVKDNIEVIENAIDKIKAIRGVTFTRKDALEEDRNKRHAGVIAQEVMKVLPEVVTGTEEDKYSVAYGNMAGLFIEAIKEQQTQIDELKQLVKQLTQK